MQHQLFFPALTFIFGEIFMTSILFSFRRREKGIFVAASNDGYFSDIANVSEFLAFLESK